MNCRQCGRLTEENFVLKQSTKGLARRVIELEQKLEALTSGEPIYEEVQDHGVLSQAQGA